MTPLIFFLRIYTNIFWFLTTIFRLNIQATQTDSLCHNISVYFIYIILYNILKTYVYIHFITF